MKLYTLTEARKPRSAYKQELKQQVLGPVTPTSGKWDMSWRDKVEQVFFDLKVSHEYRSRIMKLFELLIERNGEDYLQKVSVTVFRGLIQQLVHKYEIEPVLKKPGVSSIYTQSQTLPFHDPATAATRRSVAHLDVHRFTQDELKQHDNPVVRRLYKAIAPNANPALQDKAVVWDMSGRPFYLFVRLFKQHPGAEKPDRYGNKWFEATIPRFLDFRSGQRKMLEFDFEHYNKDTPWFKIQRSHEVVPLVKFTTTNFDAKVASLQEKAWEIGKDWFQIWEKYQEIKLQHDGLVRQHTRLTGEYNPYINLASDKATELATLSLRLEVYRALLEGRLPPANFVRKLNPEKQDEYVTRLTSLAAKMPMSYTWYLWLLISEDEYGIRIPERQQMYPAYPKEPRATKGLEPHWSIRPVQREGGTPRWNDALLAGLGFGMNDWPRFEAELRDSHYKFTKSDAEIQRLWVPLVGAIRERFGLRLHPANINEYLDMAKQANKVFHATGPVLGREGGKLTVRNRLPMPQYRFRAGDVDREFSLIPALGYLQYFDSPTHGGARLVHGQRELVPPVEKNILYNRPSSLLNPKGQELAREYERKMERLTGRIPRHLLGYDHRLAQRRRQQSELIFAENIIKLNREQFLKKANQLARIRARSSDPKWHVPTRLRSPALDPVTGRFVPRNRTIKSEVRPTVPPPISWRDYWRSPEGWRKELSPEERQQGVQYAAERYKNLLATTRERYKQMLADHYRAHTKG